MSNRACVLKVAGTDYPSRAPGFNPAFCRVSVAHLPVTCMPNVANVPGLSILVCPFGII